MTRPICRGRNLVLGNRFIDGKSGAAAFTPLTIQGA